MLGICDLDVEATQLLAETRAPQDHPLEHLLGRNVPEHWYIPRLLLRLPACQLTLRLMILQECFNQFLRLFCLDGVELGEQLLIRLKTRRDHRFLLP